MSHAERAESRRRARRIVRQVGPLPLLGAVLLAVLGDVQGLTWAIPVAVGLAATTIVMNVGLMWWLGRGLAEQARQDFAQWAAARGLQPDPEPVPQHSIADAIRQQRSRPMLMPHPSHVGRAATRPLHGGRITYLDWSKPDGDGRHTLYSGLLIHTTPTGSTLLLEPAGRRRWPQLPGTHPRHRSGHPLLDDAYVISGPTTSPYTGAAHADPLWIDAALAEALAPFATRRARIEIADDLVVVACARVTDGGRDALLEDGLRLAAALGARGPRS